MVEPPRCLADDLAPGDANARTLDWSGLHIVRIDTPAHPLFAPAYARLWQEFGARGEMERREVIAERLAWDARRPIDGHALRYELLAVCAGETLVAVRDHTAIVPPARAGAPRRTIVHLSHLVIEPARRGSGLSGWLRAVPLQTARACAAAAGVPAGPITLVEIGRAHV